MAFEGLSERLLATMQKMRGKGKLTEADIKIMMREVRLALLEADVNFKLVKEFIKTVSERALGSDVLQTVGKQIDIPVYSEGDQVKPQQIVTNALKHAKEEHLDFVIIDTAGRLHIDEALMNELKEVKDIAKPNEIMLVVDSMTGQDAANVAESFDNQLVDGLELFHPERMASRILGMGDVLSLIEKAQQDVDQEKAKDLEKKMRESSFTLDDFLEQLDQVKNLGPLDDIMKMIPGMNKMKGLDKLNMSEKQIDHIKAIIQSMTPAERNNPDTLNVSRKKRIAKGSGRSLQEVNRLMKQFNDMKKMMKQFTGGGKGKKGKRNQMQNMLKGMNLPF
nr:signal recognition particle receptor subunit alpha [Staphylococcus aureus]